MYNKKLVYSMSMDENEPFLTARLIHMKGEEKRQLCIRKPCSNLWSDEDIREYLKFFFNEQSYKNLGISCTLKRNNNKTRDTRGQWPPLDNQPTFQKQKPKCTDNSYSAWVHQPPWSRAMSSQKSGCAQAGSFAVSILGLRFLFFPKFSDDWN